MKRFVFGVSAVLVCVLTLAGVGELVGDVTAQVPGPQASLVQACAQGESLRFSVSVRAYSPREDLGDYILRANQEGDWQLDSLTRGHRRFFFDGSQYLASDSIEPNPVVSIAPSLVVMTDVLSQCRSGFVGGEWLPIDPWEDGFAEVRPAAVTEWMKFVVPPLPGVATVPEAYVEFARSGLPVTVVLKQVDTWIEVKLWDVDLAVVDPFVDFSPVYPLGGPSDRGSSGYSCGTN